MAPLQKKDWLVMFGCDVTCARVQVWFRATLHGPIFHSTSGNGTANLYVCHNATLAVAKIGLTDCLFRC